jgi:hypothetical protein
VIGRGTVLRDNAAIARREMLMQTETIQIIDKGRGPQLSTTRITVLDVFYYLHRGHDYEYVCHAMPTLSRQEFDVVVEYVNAHHDELVEMDRKAEEFIEKGVEAQRARGGTFADSDAGLTTEQRVARLRETVKRKTAEKNGQGHLDIDAIRGTGRLFLP